MTPIRAVVFSALLIAFLLPYRAGAQALPTASQTVHLSAFAGGSGVFTNLSGGHNLSFTAGLDLTVATLRGYHPSIELRGTYPVHTGHVDSQKSAMGGIRVDRQFNNLRPYIDVLFGRGEIDYQSGGYVVGPITYISSTTNVYSLGGGLDYDFTDHLSLKVDLQSQFWSTPVVPSNHIYPIVGTLAIVYRFGNNHPKHHIPPAPPTPATPKPTPVE